jgi:ABC-2 type transport system ATP-binding protein
MDALPVEARGLVKRYGRITACDGVDLNVNRGDVYGYLGPNGAGKTTCLRIVFGLVRPTQGSVRLFGKDPCVDGVAALDGVAGFVEAPRLYPYLTGRKNLELCAALDRNSAEGQIDEVLETVGLSDRAGDRVGGYSHGMAQRLGIAAALLRNPSLLVLDEPTTGLDPAGMRDMRVLIRSLAQRQITVLLSSHLLTEVEELCNRVAIVRTGRVIYEGSLAALKERAVGMHRLRTSDPARACEVCEAHPNITDVGLIHDEVHFQAAEQAVAELSVGLVEAGVAITALVPETPNLEQLFFRLTEGDGDLVPAQSAGQTDSTQ